MKGISRKFFNKHISDSKVVKALELYLFVKVRYEAFSSTIKDFRYNRLSEETGLCFTTLKKTYKYTKTTWIGRIYRERQTTSFIQIT